MSCSDISCGFNAFIENGTCWCSENSLGTPDSLCTSYIELFWYFGNSIILLCGSILCCKRMFERRKYNKYNDENQFLFSKNDF